ncbi:MAG: HlyD family efflux transporter periplasmic adaptor subunit [Parvularculaceae bacterium]
MNIQRNRRRRRLPLPARAAAQGALAQAVAEAEAQYRNAQISYERSKKLYAERVIAKARLDADLASFDAAKARLERARSEQAAAEREWSAATASEDLARKRVSDLEVYAPAAGTIERIYRRGGEIVGAGEPVLSLLPPENVKVRFYAPQATCSRRCRRAMKSSSPAMAALTSSERGSAISRASRNSTRQSFTASTSATSSSSNRERPRSEAARPADGGEAAMNGSCRDD